MLSILKSIAVCWTGVSGRLRQFTYRRGLYQEPNLSLSKGGPVDWLFQLVFPVMAFGVMFGPRLGSIAGSLALGVACTAALFALARLVHVVYYSLAERTAGAHWTVKLAVALVYLALFLVAPVAVIAVAAQLFPAYVSAGSWGDLAYKGFMVYVADTLLSQLTGVRLFLEAPKNQPAAASQERQPSRSTKGSL